MPLREVKKKIRVVENVHQITSALELISSVKMRKAEKLALQSRPFTRKVLEILLKLQNYQEEFKKTSIYFKENKSKKNLMVVISSDKGFCGAFNKIILNFAQSQIDKEKDEIFAVGKKAIRFFRKRNYNVVMEFFGIGDYGEFEEVKPIADILLKSFLEGKYGKIYLFYMDFISPFKRKPRKFLVLPLDWENLMNLLKDYQLRQKKLESSDFKPKVLDYILEPNATAILEGMVPLLIQYLIYHSILEANASEHSARMFAMREASKNAKEILENLKLLYFKERQNLITNEILEISAAKEAILE
jgi:F-type H+-transporting ATPase subunit gamma